MSALALSGGSLRVGGDFTIAGGNVSGYFASWHRFVCGDANSDDAIDSSDVAFLINYIFSGGPAPNPVEAGDANCDDSIDISDVVCLINYIFSGGPAPCTVCNQAGTLSEPMAGSREAPGSFLAGRRKMTNLISGRLVGNSSNQIQTDRCSPLRLA